MTREQARVLKAAAAKADQADEWGVALIEHWHPIDRELYLAVQALRASIKQEVTERSGLCAENKDKNSGIESQRPRGD